MIEAMAADEPEINIEKPESAESAETSADDGEAGKRSDERDQQDEQQRREDVETLMSEHSEKANPLTEVNANKALEGPPGTTAEVGGAGTPGADVTFRDDSGEVVAQREVKALAGGESAFNNRVSEGAAQVGYNGEVFVQMPEGADAADGERMVDNFQGWRSDADLARYENVQARLVSREGDELGTYKLGDRLRDRRED